MEAISTGTNPDFCQVLFEYRSLCRRIIVWQEHSTFILSTSYCGVVSEVKPWSKTYGEKEHAYGWAMAALNNREISISPSFTVKEASGKILVDRCQHFGK